MWFLSAEENSFRYSQNENGSSVWLETYKSSFLSVIPYLHTAHYLLVDYRELYCRLHDHLLTLVHIGLGLSLHATVSMDISLHYTPENIKIHV